MRGIRIPRRDYRVVIQFSLEGGWASGVHAMRKKAVEHTKWLKQRGER